MQTNSKKQYLVIAILPIIAILILLYNPILTYLFGKEITIEAMGTIYDNKYYDNQYYDDEYEHEAIDEIDVDIDSIKINYDTDVELDKDIADYSYEIDNQIPSYMDEFSYIELDTEAIEENKSRWDKDVADYSKKMFEKYKDNYKISDKSRRNAYIILEKEGDYYEMSSISLAKPKNKLFLKCSIEVFEEYIADEFTMPGISISLNTEDIYDVKDVKIKDVEHQFMRRVEDRIECKVYLKYKLYNGFLLKIK